MAEEREKLSRFKETVKEWTESLLVAFVLAMTVRTFVIQAFKIPTGSMEPTLKPRDRILVNKFIYRFKEPERGDVIVFRYPLDTRRDFIKRLIAKPGETVKIENGYIYIDGKKIDSHPVIKQIYYYNRGSLGNSPEGTKVPENSFFVLGDNSAFSQDSRYWGFVPRKYILGKAILIYWPIQRIGIIR
ncbi:MAG: signal peptidase I [Candidatus Omnitrophica bacterium]|nr:signal peptidase I [Candidatus Omnitrophota bacterium]MCM8798840.1 signal peptidase I [Candidatus Omnitrophota bacterium]